MLVGSHGINKLQLLVDLSNAASVILGFLLFPMLQKDDTKLLLAAIRAVHKVCVHIINAGELQSDKKSCSAAGNIHYYSNLW
jgi:hypothetical protein